MPDIRHKKKIGLLNDSDLMRYLFLADFTRMPDQELTDGQVLPVQVGEASFLEDAPLELEITDGVFKNVVSAIYPNLSRIRSTNTLPASPGVALLVRIKRLTTQAYPSFALNKTTTLPALGETETITLGNGFEQWRETAVLTGVYPTTLGAWYRAVLVSQNSHRMLLVDGGQGWKLTPVWAAKADKLLDTSSQRYFVSRYMGSQVETSRIAVANLPANGYPEFGSRDLDVVYSSPAIGTTLTLPENFEVSFTAPAVASSGYLHLRGVDASNTLSIYHHSNGSFYLKKIVGAASTLLANCVLPVNSKVEVLFNGSNIKAYVNGALGFEYNTSEFLGETWGKVESFAPPITIRTLEGVAEVTAPKVYDYSGNGIHATPSNVLFLPSSQTTPETGLSGYYNGTNAYATVDVSDLGVQHTGFALAYVKKSFEWSELVQRYLFQLKSTGNDQVFIRKRNTSGHIEWWYEGNDVLANGFTDKTGQADTFSAGISWSSQTGESRQFWNGMLERVRTSITPAQFPFTDMSFSMSSHSFWIGNIYDVLLANSVPSDLIVAEIHEHLEAGTLSKAYLDAAFGPGNYVWYKHDKPKLEQAENPGLATTVLPGPVAQGTQFVHEPDFVAQWQMVDASQYHTVAFRQKNSTNFWQLQVHDMGDGTYRALLIKQDEGVNTNLSFAYWSIADPHTITLIVEGSSITVYADNTLLFTYSTATEFQGESLGYIRTVSSGILSNLVIWPRRWPEAHRVVEALNKLAGEA